MTKKFTVIMLVSRDNVLLKRAVESVVRQEPDEFRAYIDSVLLRDDRKARRILKHAEAKILTQIINSRFDHHTNLVHNYHRALLEAENKWIMKCDDDDEIIGEDRRPILKKYADNEVGLIHGDKIVKGMGGGDTRILDRVPLPTRLVWHLKGLTARLGAYNLVRIRARAHQGPVIHKGRPVTDYRDLLKTPIYGGSAILNQDAFQRIHPILDHGYFFDWKVFYWILRAGWKAVYIPRPMFLQNVNPNPGSIRRSYHGKWGRIMDQLNKIPDEIVDMLLNENPKKDWRYHKRIR